MEQIRQRKIEYLKHRRNTEEIAPIEINGAIFDFDETAQMRLLWAREYMERNNVAGIPWTTATNETAVITVESINSLIDAAAVRSNAAHIKYRSLLEQVKSANSYNAVAAVEW